MSNPDKINKPTFDVDPDQFQAPLVFDVKPVVAMDNLAFHRRM